LAQSVIPIAANSGHPERAFKRQILAPFGTKGISALIWKADLEALE
jgi:hypothetical protein